MFKNEEYSSFLNIFICFVLKHDKFTSFISLFRPLGYPIKPRPLIKILLKFDFNMIDRLSCCSCCPKLAVLLYRIEMKAINR